MSGKSKPSQTLDGLSQEAAARAKAQRDVGKRSGIYGKAIDEPVPTLEMVDSEKLIGKGENNSFIVLGRDRPSHARSGEGGRGATQCGRIDLIAGLGSSYKRSDGTIGPPDQNTVLNPNFALDAARVYVSQKTDLDKYMGITKVPGQIPPGSSGIGLKADSIRIHSRHDVKIVTGRARLEGLGKQGELMSNGVVNDRVGTISFIAGNFNTDADTTREFNFLTSSGRKSYINNRLQPIPKGRNLMACLGDIIDALNEVMSEVSANGSMINQMNNGLKQHIHPPITGAPSPDYQIASAVITAQTTTHGQSRNLLVKRIDTIKTNYLQDFTGNKYINSHYVFTT